MAKTLPFGAPLGPCFNSIAKVLVLVIVKVKVNIEKKVIGTQPRPSLEEKSR